MTDAALDLQKALYAALKLSSGLTNLIGTPPRLFDHYPEDPIFPFVVLSENRCGDWSGVEGGLEHDIRIHAYSLYGGQREAKEMASFVHAALHDQPLPLDHFHLVNLRYVFGDILRLRDGETFQAVMRYRAVTHP